jgi:hypothetical protein
MTRSGNNFLEIREWDIYVPREHDNNYEGSGYGQIADFAFPSPLSTERLRTAPDTPEGEEISEHQIHSALISIHGSSRIPRGNPILQWES